MKTKSMKKKLNLHKIDIVRLNGDRLNRVKAGYINFGNENGSQCDGCDETVKDCPGSKPVCLTWKWPACPNEED